MINFFRLDNVDFAIANLENIDLSNIILSNYDRENLEKISNLNRRKEFLSVRKVMQLLLEKSGYSYYGLCKTSNGVPFLLKVKKNINISLSHSDNYVAAAFAIDHVIGIDLQYYNEKISKIKNKFLTPQDNLISLSIPDLTLSWAMKESSYKLLSTIFQNLSFKKIKIISDNTTEYLDYIIKIDYKIDDKFCFVISKFLKSN